MLAPDCRAMTGNRREKMVKEASKMVSKYTIFSRRLPVIAWQSGANLTLLTQECWRQIAGQ
jgi:hypothetical protein